MKIYLTRALHGGNGEEEGREVDPLLFIPVLVLNKDAILLVIISVQLLILIPIL
jgi:hypothetical protein